MRGNPSRDGDETAGSGEIIYRYWQYRIKELFEEAGLRNGNCSTPMST